MRGAKGRATGASGSFPLLSDSFCFVFFFLTVLYKESAGWHRVGQARGPGHGDTAPSRGCCHPAPAPVLHGTLLMSPVSAGWGSVTERLLSRHQAWVPSPALLNAGEHFRSFHRGESTFHGSADREGMDAGP